MISRQTVTHPFSRGNYISGSPTPPRWAVEQPMIGAANLQGTTVDVPDDVIDALRATGADVRTTTEEIVAGTRDWWAGSMISETSGNPAATEAVIVRVTAEDQVAAVIRIAAEHRIPVTPSAGRSNVTGAAIPVFGGIVLDVCGLDQITDYDPASQIVEVQAGMFGDLFEKQLQDEFGVTLGHWPSAFAISTVGGWVACRGAGQLSTRYGKIEDMVVGLDIVLPDGSEASFGTYPRAAIGPDLKQLFIGSEGTLGVITRLRLRTYRLPAYAGARAYGFETFAAGLDACREILQRGGEPAVLRLYDRLESGTHFDHGDTNLLLIADEGNPLLVDATMAITEDVCREHGRPLDGDAIFERWLDERMVTGKSGDGFAKGPGFVADTCEIAGRWSVLSAVYDDVVAAIQSVPGTLAASAHQSHAYVDGACIYFSLRGDVAVDDRMSWYQDVWAATNDVLIRHGAAISHHHGCGLLRSPYVPDALASGFGTLVAVKAAIDPNGIMNPGKLGLPTDLGQLPHFGVESDTLG